MLAHLFGWIYQFLGAIILIVVLSWAIIAGEPKQVNRKLDRGFEPLKPTVKERLRLWVHR